MGAGGLLDESSKAEFANDPSVFERGGDMMLYVGVEEQLRQACSMWVVVFEVGEYEETQEGLYNNYIYVYPQRESCAALKWSSCERNLQMMQILLHYAKEQCRGH